MDGLTTARRHVEVDMLAQGDGDWLSALNKKGYLKQSTSYVQEGFSLGHLHHHDLRAALNK